MPEARRHEWGCQIEEVGQEETVALAESEREAARVALVARVVACEQQGVNKW